MIFQKIIFSSASRGLKATPSSSRQRQAPNLDRTPFHWRAHTSPTHSHWHNWDMPVNLMCTSFVDGRKPSTWRKSPQMWRECANSTEWPQLGIDFFCYSHRCYNVRKDIEQNVSWGPAVFHLKFHQVYLCVRWLFLFKLIIEILFRLFMWKR